jgi:hypothetical protein
MKRRRSGGGSRGVVSTVTSKHGLALIAAGAVAGLYALGSIQSTTDTNSWWYKLGQFTGLKPKSA